MRQQILHENWTLCLDGEQLPAQVPGSVYNDLLTNGRMEDPYYRDNELKALARAARCCSPPERSYGWFFKR